MGCTSSTPLGDGGVLETKAIKSPKSSPRESKNNKLAKSAPSTSSKPAARDSPDSSDAEAEESDISDRDDPSAQNAAAPAASPDVLAPLVAAASQLTSRLPRQSSITSHATVPPTPRRAGSDTNMPQLQPCSSVHSEGLLSGNAPDFGILTPQPSDVYVSRFEHIAWIDLPKLPISPLMAQGPSTATSNAAFVRQMAAASPFAAVGSANTSKHPSIALISADSSQHSLNSPAVVALAAAPTPISAGASLASLGSLGSMGSFGSLGLVPAPARTAIAATPVAVSSAETSPASPPVTSPASPDTAVLHDSSYMLPQQHLLPPRAQPVPEEDEAAVAAAEAEAQAEAEAAAAAAELDLFDDDIADPDAPQPASAFPVAAPDALAPAAPLVVATRTGTPGAAPPRTPAAFTTDPERRALRIRAQLRPDDYAYARTAAELHRSPLDGSLHR